MVAMTWSSIRRYLAYGSGVAVTLQADRLDAVLVRVRPNGAQLAGTFSIAGFRTRPAAEWGREFLDQAAKAGFAHIPVLVILPRESVILRTIQLPGVEDQDAAAAIAFQLDSLHPFPEDEVVHDWRRLPESSNFVVAIAEKKSIEEVTTLFAEAGVPLSGVSVSAAVLHPALRALGERPPEGFITVVADSESGDARELYGESPARRLYSVGLEQDIARLMPGALSELRLSAGVTPQSLPELLKTPDIPGLSQIAYAGALVAACWYSRPVVNLLPLELRAAPSKLRLVPTAVLTGLVAICGVVLASQGAWHDRRYLSLLKSEIARVEPNARKVEALDKKIGDTAAKARLLEDFRQRTKADLDLLAELTRLLPAPTYLQSLDLNRGDVVIVGETEQAEGLLKTLDKSPLMMNSEFTTPIAKSTSGEGFRIRAAREGVR